MTLILYAVVGGVVLGLIGQGKLPRLGTSRLRFQLLMLFVFLGTLALQAGLGARLGRSMAIGVWSLLVLLLIAACVANVREPGVLLVLVGLSCNLLVVLANSGMPVVVANAPGGARAAAEMLRAVGNSWLYVAASDDTKFWVFGDVIPIGGPAWHRGMMSLGDALLAIGVARHVAVTMLVDPTPGLESV